MIYKVNFLLRTTISALFQVRTNSKNENKSHLNDLIVPNENDNNFGRIKKDKINQKNTIIMKNNKKYRYNQFTKQELFENTVDEIKARSKYSYSVLDVIYNIFWSFKWFKFTLSKICKSFNRRSQLYLRGKNKLFKELSVTQFVKMQHKLKLILRLLFTKHDRLIASYQKMNWISNTSDSQNICSSDSIDKMMSKMFDDLNAKKAHNEAFDQLFKEYPQVKQFSKDLILMHAVQYCAISVRSNKKVSFIKNIVISLYCKNIKIKNISFKY